jgi:hypothetical protein
MKPHRLRPADRLGVRPLLLVAAALAGATLFAAAAQAKDTILMSGSTSAASGADVSGSVASRIRVPASGPPSADCWRSGDRALAEAGDPPAMPGSRCGPARARRGAPAGGGIRAAPRSARADPPM